MFAGALNLGELGAELMAGAEFVLSQLRVTNDDGEQIVEIVRDTAGEPADRLHLLRVPKLFIQPFVAGNEAPNARQHVFWRDGAGRILSVAIGDGLDSELVIGLRHQLRDLIV